MKRFLVVFLLAFFLLSPIINAQNDEKLSDDEKEKLRQELLRVQRQVRTDFQRLRERMQKTKDSIKDLTDPVDKENAERLENAITLMKELKVDLDMDDLELKIQNKNYFAAMQLSNEITEKLKKIIKALEKGSVYNEDPNIKKLEEAIKNIEDIQREQKDIEERTEQTFKNSDAREYQDMMRKTEQLIEKQMNLQKETAAMNSRLKEAEESIKKLEALKNAQQEMGEMTDKLKEGKDLKEKQRLSLFEEVLKELVELIRDQSSQITEINSHAELKQLTSDLSNILKMQKDYLASLDEAEKSNTTLKTFNDIKEIESTIKLILSIRSAEEDITSDEELAKKMLEPQKQLQTLINKVTKDMLTLVQSNPNNADLKTALTFIQDTEQDIEKTIEYLTDGKADKCRVFQEKTSDAIGAVILKMQNIIKTNVPELPIYAKNLEELSKSLSALHDSLKQISNKITEASVKKEIDQHVKSINSAVISLQAVASQLNNFSSRLAIKDMNLCIESINKSIKGFDELFKSETIVKFLNLKASDQVALKKRLEKLMQKLETIAIVSDTEVEEEMLTNAYEGTDKFIEKLKDSTNSKINEYRDNLKTQIDKAKETKGNPAELEKLLIEAAKNADKISQELRLDANANSNDLAILATFLKDMLESVSLYVNTRENAVKALTTAGDDMTKAQEHLNNISPLLAKGKQIDAVENLYIAKDYLEKELEKSLNKKAFDELSQKQNELEKKTDEAAKELDQLAQKNSSKNAESAAKNARESAKSMNKASENLKKQQSSNAQTSQKKAEKDLQKAIDEMKKEKEELEKMLGEKSKELSKKQEALKKELDDLQNQLGNKSAGEKDEEKKNMVEKAQESGKKASKNMQGSKESLEQNKSSDSQQQQEEAVKDLEEMKEDLKKLAEESLNAEEKLRYEKLQQEQKELEEKTKKLRDEMKENSPKAQDELNKAQEKMRESEKNLGNQQGNSAQKNQQQAQDHLNKAKKDLEKLLRDYEERQNNELLLHVEQQLEKLLKSQIIVNQKTNSVKQESDEAGRVDRKLARQLRKIADEQKSLSSSAEELSKKLEEGRIPIFAFEMNKVGLDMKEVADELKTKNLDEYVIEIQEDILRRLKDMLAAIRAERKRRQEDPQPPMQPNDGKMVPRLVPIPAELELLKRKQEYIRAKHEQFMKRYPNLKSREEMTRPQRRLYERLSAQQGLTAKQLEEMTKSLFEEQPQPGN